MRELQHKQKVKHRIYSVPALVVLFLLTIFAVRSAFSVIQKEHESAQYLADLQTKLSALSARQDQLKTEIAKLDTTAGIDSLIKEKYSVSAPGEHVAIIVDQPAATTSESTSTPNWFQQLWHNITNLW